MRTNQFVLELIAKAEEHLMSTYQGFWSDFILMPGSSNLWISAMVITITKHSIDPVLQAFRHDAFNNLVTYSDANGFCIGYNNFTPCDCDSSVWLARAYTSVKRQIPKDLLAYINLHLAASSCDAFTYIPSDNVDKFIGVHHDRMDGWYSTHTCVTANYLSLLRDINTSSTDKINDVSHKLFLDSYWWPTDSYIIALCPHLLAETFFSCRHLDTFIPSFNPPLDEYPNADILLSILKFLFSFIRNGITDNNGSLYEMFDITSKVLIDPSNHAWMILPFPHDLDRHTQSAWEYNGLVQGAAVSDRKGIFTVCTILSLLYYIRDHLLIMETSAMAS